MARTLNQTEIRKIQSLQATGTPIGQIAREVKKNRTTVRRYMLDINAEPEGQNRETLGPFTDHIREEMKQGRENANNLLNDIRARGYRGAREELLQFMRPLRKKNRGIAKAANSEREEAKTTAITPTTPEPATDTETAESAVRQEQAKRVPNAIDEAWRKAQGHPG